MLVHVSHHSHLYVPWAMKDMHDVWDFHAHLKKLFSVPCATARSLRRSKKRANFSVGSNEPTKRSSFFALLFALPISVATLVCLVNKSTIRINDGPNQIFDQNSRKHPATGGTISIPNFLIFYTPSPVLQHIPEQNYFCENDCKCSEWNPDKIVHCSSLR